jgi:hypothetical protein
MWLSASHKRGLFLEEETDWTQFCMSQMPFCKSITNLRGGSEVTERGVVILGQNSNELKNKNLQKKILKTSRQGIQK